MAYFVRFTHGNKSTVLYESTDRAAAMAYGEKKQAELQAAGSKGILSLYEKTAAPGIPARKCYEFWRV